jgi:hypothetical protein
MLLKEGKWKGRLFGVDARKKKENRKGGKWSNGNSICVCGGFPRAN